MNIPDLCSVEEKCCGCGACYSVCPKKAIEMRADDKGFLYPWIDETKCVGCGKCLRVCAFKKDQISKKLY